MSFTFNCPTCDQPIQAGKETAGLRGRCPHCSTTLTIPDGRSAFRKEPPPIEIPPPPEEEVSDREEWEDRQSRYDRYDRQEEYPSAALAPGWNSVRTGVNLVRIGLLTILFAILGMVLIAAVTAAMMPARGGGRESETILGITAVLTGLVMLTAAILTVVGQCLCCAAPEEAGVKGLAIGSIICLFIFLLLTVLAVFSLILLQRRGPFGIREEAAALPLAILFLAYVVGLVHHLLFVLFLKGTARNFRNEGLAKSLGSYLITLIVFIVLGLVLSLFLVAAGLAMNRGGQAVGILAGLFGFGLLIYFLVIFLWFLGLLSRTAKAIGREERSRWYA